MMLSTYELIATEKFEKNKFVIVGGQYESTSYKLTIHSVRALKDGLFKVAFIA